MEKDGTFDKLPKKEVVGLKKEYEKLNKNLCGIREMTKLPQAIIIVDSTKEYTVVILGDTNGDGSITILDLLRIQKQLLNSITF